MENLLQKELIQRNSGAHSPLTMMRFVIQNLQYSGVREPNNEAIYKALLDVSMDSTPAAIKKLRAAIEDLLSNHRQCLYAMDKTLEDATSLSGALDGISKALDEDAAKAGRVQP